MILGSRARLRASVLNISKDYLEGEKIGKLIRSTAFTAHLKVLPSRRKRLSQTSVHGVVSFPEAGRRPPGECRAGEGRALESKCGARSCIPGRATRCQEAGREDGGLGEAQPRHSRDRHDPLWLRSQMGSQ